MSTITEATTDTPMKYYRVEWQSIISGPSVFSIIKGTSENDAYIRSAMNHYSMLDIKETHEVTEAEARFMATSQLYVEHMPNDPVF